MDALVVVTPEVMPSLTVQDTRSMVVVLEMPSLLLPRCGLCPNNKISSPADVSAEPLPPVPEHAKLLLLLHVAMPVVLLLLVLTVRVCHDLDPLPSKFSPRSTPSLMGPCSHNSVMSLALQGMVWIDAPGGDKCLTLWEVPRFMLRLAAQPEDSQQSDILAPVLHPSRWAGHVQPCLAQQPRHLLPSVHVQP